jgi:hypothetical protein
MNGDNPSLNFDMRWSESSSSLDDYPFASPRNPLAAPFPPPSFDVDSYMAV